MSRGREHKRFSAASVEIAIFALLPQLPRHLRGNPPKWRLYFWLAVAVRFFKSSRGRTGSPSVAGSTRRLRSSSSAASVSVNVRGPPPLRRTCPGASGGASGRIEVFQSALNGTTRQPGIRRRAPRSLQTTASLPSPAILRSMLRKWSAVNLFTLHHEFPRLVQDEPRIDHTRARRSQTTLQTLKARARFPQYSSDCCPRRKGVHHRQARGGSPAAGGRAWVPTTSSLCAFERSRSAISAMIPDCDYQATPVRRASLPKNSCHARAPPRKIAKLLIRRHNSHRSPIIATVP
jgi:hypothetical protein